MTNREKFKEEILDMACDGMTFAVQKDTNKPVACRDLDCSKCIFEDDCNINRFEWCNAEYIEPCEFEKDELVEVSNDGKNWKLRYFSQMYKGKCYAFVNGNKSTENSEDYPWEYCRKYGTLGKENK